MTRFLCQELLYEYMTGALDPAREKDVREYLPTCRESQREFERLARAMEYTDKAAAARVSPNLHQALLSFEPTWRKRLRELSTSSAPRAWVLLPYVFVLVTIAIGLIVWRPWDPKSHEAVIAEGPRRVPDQGDAALRTPVPPPPPLVERQRRRAEVKGPRADEVRAQAMDLGGTVSGEGPELDISLPESKLPAFEAYLATFGPVRFTPEKEEREMPEGQIRIILIVNEGPSATP